MTLADDWYEDWISTVTRKHNRDRHYRQKLQSELAGVKRDVALAGETAYDAHTDSLRRTLHASPQPIRGVPA